MNKLYKLCIIGYSDSVGVSAALVEGPFNEARDRDGYGENRSCGSGLGLQAVAVVLRKKMTDFPLR